MACIMFFASLALQLQLGNPANLVKVISPGKIASSLITLGVVYLLVHLSRRLLEALSRKVPRARFFFKLLVPITGFALWLIGGLIVLHTFAPSQSTFLAVIASVGLAVGLGAQDLVRNFIGGLVILVDRPYQLGDLVQIGDALGEIDHIGLRSTKLTTFGDTRVTIPNSDILNGKAWCANSGVPDCQVETFLYLPCDTDPATAEEIAYEATYSSPYVLLVKPVQILLQDGFQYGPYLRVQVKAYVYDHRYQPRFQSDVTSRAKAEFLKRGMLKGWNLAAFYQRPPRVP